MATDVPPQAQEEAAARGWRPYRLTVRQYLKMIEAGVFPDDAHVELLGGLLVQQMTKYDPHDFTTDNLGRTLDRLLTDDWIVRQEKSAVLGRHWRPEPDLAVVRGPARRYESQAPGPADVALLIEVADSSYGIDRGAKWRRYAAVGIPAYWIVHLAKRRIEVYTDPAGRGRSASYRSTFTFDDDDRIPVIIGGREISRLVVRDMLPRA